MTPWFGDALKSLIYNIITTWTRSWNNYDNNQWTLLPLLKGSMLIYTMLFATAYVKPRYRMLVELGLFVYYYVSNDCEFSTSSRKNLTNTFEPPSACNSSWEPSSPTSPNTRRI